MKHVFQIRFGKWAYSNASFSVGKCANTGHLSSSGFSLCPNRYLSEITRSKPHHSLSTREKTLPYYRGSLAYPQGYGKKIYEFVFISNLKMEKSLKEVQLLTNRASKR